MDTRFWGPSGWRLLHLIAFSYEPDKQKEEVRELFETLPFVLPCKFCRASLAEYMEEDPLEPALKSRETLSKWLWRIHNMVNEKLRGQGLLKEANPSFASVKGFYDERVEAGCIRTDFESGHEPDKLIKPSRFYFEGWEFLFSIADNHPLTQSMKNSLPMSDIPDIPDIPEVTEEIKNSPEFRNRWNLMKPEERMKFYTRFWKSIGGSLPFESWRSAWKSCPLDFSRIRKKSLWIRELWRIRCCLEKELELVNRDEFQSLCKRLVENRSGCGKKKRARTCRSIRKVRKTRKVY